MHKDRSTRQVRIWLRPETIKQLKLLTLLMGRDDWNIVCDDAVRAGVAYINEVHQLKMAEWNDTIKLLDLDQDLKLRTMKGRMPRPEDSD